MPRISPLRSGDPEIEAVGTGRQPSGIFSGSCAELLAAMSFNKCAHKYMARSGRGRSQTWKTFLRNHAASIGAMDFLIVPTARFRLSLVKDSPDHRPIKRFGRLTNQPILGGLHHYYCRI